MAKLTAKYIEALSRRVAKGETVKEWHPDGDGLYLRVRPSGHMSFEVRKRPFKPLPLGSAVIGLPKARELAREALVEQARGVDPAVRRRQEKADRTVAAAAEANTFSKIVGHFIADHAKPNLRTWREVKRALDMDVLSVLGNLPIADVDTTHLRDLLREKKKSAPRQAGALYAYLSKFFKWARGNGYVTRNPVEGLPKPSQQKSRERVLTDEELALVWNASMRLDWPFAPIVQLLALTGQRKMEIAGGEWSEIDLNAKAWRLPGTRTKNKLPHEFPLSEAALGIIKQLPRMESPAKRGQAFEPSDLVFTTTGNTVVSGFSRAKRNIDEAIAELNGGLAIPHWTFHDLRRTAATGMKAIGIATDVIEATLNHVSGERRGVAGIYNRHSYSSEKRQALDAWSRRLEEIVTGKVPGNVVDLAQARAADGR